ncbi:MAG: Rab family GTPase [Promethearchaeota archaeon]
MDLKREIMLKVSIFGEKNVGKTTLTKRYLTGLFDDDIKSTLGSEIFIKFLNFKNYLVTLQIWDFGGEDKFRFLLPIYSKGSHGGIFMYDLSRPNTLNKINEFLDLFKQGLEENKKEIPILLVGGKLDLINTSDGISENIRNLMESRNFCNFIKCSSITGENVERLFELLIENILD